MADTFAYLHGKLDGFHDAISNLSENPSQDALEKFASYLSPDGEFYFGGMNVPPARKRNEAIDGMKQLLKYWRLKERRVRVRAITRDGKSAIAEMDNVLEILGERLEFKEIEVADFNDDGLIVGFRIYCDNKPLEEILTKHGRTP